MEGEYRRECLMVEDGRCLVMKYGCKEERGRERGYREVQECKSGTKNKYKVMCERDLTRGLCERMFCPKE
jgi:hypothetical protein